jgi:hypothetical protein
MKTMAPTTCNIGCRDALGDQPLGGEPNFSAATLIASSALRACPA